MFRWLSEYIPGRKQNSEEDSDTSDGESASSEETTYLDSVDDDRDVDPKATSSSPERYSSIYPPLSSIQMTEAAAGPSERQLEGFISLEPEDDFDQSCTPLASAITQRSPARKAKEFPAFTNDVKKDLSLFFNRCTSEPQQATASKVELHQPPVYSIGDWIGARGEIAPVWNCKPDAELANATGVIFSARSPTFSFGSGHEINGKRVCTSDGEQANATGIVFSARSPTFSFGSGHEINEKRVCTSDGEQANATGVVFSAGSPTLSFESGHEINGKRACTPDGELTNASVVVFSARCSASSPGSGHELSEERASIHSNRRSDTEQDAGTETRQSTFSFRDCHNRDGQHLQSSVDTPLTGSPAKRPRQDCYSYSKPPTPVNLTSKFEKTDRPAPTSSGEYAETSDEPLLEEDPQASKKPSRRFGRCAETPDGPLLEEELIRMDESHRKDLNLFETPSAPRQTYISRQLRDALMFPDLSEQAKALGKFDFVRHVFPLLTRLEGRCLEDEYEVGDKRLEDCQQLSGNGEKSQFTRSIPSVDPGSYLYDCQVDSQGSLRFKITENRQGTTILQRTLGPDKVLRVFFTCTKSQADHALYARIAKTGIVVGCRLYKYFVHMPDDDKRSNEGTTKCYFVCIDSIGERDRKDETFKRFQKIEDARTLFMHIHTSSHISNYIARLKLLFSKTMTVDMPYDLVIHIEEDVVSKDPAASEAMFTDGTGFISSDLAKMMPSDVYKGRASSRGQGTSDPEVQCIP